MATRGAAPANVELADSAIPVGAMLPFPTQAAQTGWLPMDGSQQPTVSFPALSAKLGTTFGTASAGFFRLPDAVGRQVIGVSPGGNSEVNAVGDSDAVAQASRNGAVHNHGGRSHTHGVSGGTAGNNGSLFGVQTGGGTLLQLNGHTHSVNGTTDATTDPTTGNSQGAYETAFWMIKT